jgi:hypothetical protein
MFFIQCTRSTALFKEEFLPPPKYRRLDPSGLIVQFHTVSTVPPAFASIVCGLASGMFPGLEYQKARECNGLPLLTFRPPHFPPCYPVKATSLVPLT